MPLSTCAASSPWQSSGEGPRPETFFCWQICNRLLGYRDTFAEPWWLQSITLSLCSIVTRTQNGGKPEARVFSCISKPWKTWRYRAIFALASLCWGTCEVMLGSKNHFHSPTGPGTWADSQFILRWIWAGQVLLPWLSLHSLGLGMHCWKEAETSWHFESVCVPALLRSCCQAHPQTLEEERSLAHSLPDFCFLGFTVGSLAVSQLWRWLCTKICFRKQLQMV